MQLLAVVLVVARPLRLHVVVDVAPLRVFDPGLQFVQINEAILVHVNLVDDHTGGAAQRGKSTNTHKWLHKYTRRCH